MKQKKYTTAQRLGKLEKVTTQLFLTIVQMQKQIKKLDPDYKTFDDEILEEETENKEELDAKKETDSE